MPNYTPKLNLEKPIGSEFYNVLTVQNVNSDKIDANAIDTDLKNDCMAGGDIKGYIEDGTQHNVNEIWLSRNSIGEFKCLIANTDNFPDLTPANPKWVQIDDKTNSSKIENLIQITGTVYGAPAPKKGTPIEIKVGQFDGAALTTGLVTFATPFATNCVYVSFTDTSSSSVVGIALSAAFTKTGFNWRKSDPTYDLGGCNYMAIGY